jgi:hypothetical protein
VDQYEGIEESISGGEGEEILGPMSEIGASARPSTSTFKRPTPKKSTHWEVKKFKFS